MKWNDHSNLAGSHAFLSASKYSWLNYDDESLECHYKNAQAAEKGTEDHAFACLCIQRRQKLPKSMITLNMYVNDAIGFRMTPEQVLYYSDNAYGTADAISFDKNFLRIHDLKTGVTPASLKQLEIYAAFFCLEYRVKPGEIGMELRIYQNNDILIGNPTAEDILPIMDKIVIDDEIINRIKEGE